KSDVTADFRQFVFAQNSRRYRPGRVQGQPFDHRLELRRGPLRTTDLYARLPDRHPVAVVAQLPSGDIHQQQLALHVAGVPAPAFEIDAQLIEPRRGADIERVQRTRADDAIHLERTL